MPPEQDSSPELEALVLQGEEGNDTLNAVEANTAATAVATQETNTALKDIEDTMEARMMQAESHIKKVSPSLESLGRAMETVDTILNTMRGPKGEKGDKGDTGEQGEKGDRGDAGKDAHMVGPIGPEGRQGETGPQGPEGKVGKIGPKGAKGEAGKDGKDGANGKDGKDADEIKITSNLSQGIDKEFENIKRYVQGSKTVNLTDIPELQSATTGQVPVKQANGTWAPGAGVGGAVEGTAVLSTGEVGGTKFLREDGDGTSSWQTIAAGGDVTKVGTPVNNQIGVWTGDGTIEGDVDLTFDTATNTLATGIVTVVDDVYAAGWNGSTAVPTKNAVYDKIEGLSAVYAPVLGGDDNYVTDAEKVKLSNLSGTNSGDQTTIVGITGTLAQFNTAVTDADLARTDAANTFTGTQTITQIDVGNTDTSITRSAAGQIAVEGVQVDTVSNTVTLTNKRITARVYSAANNASLTPEKDTYDIFHLTAMSANTTINNHSTTTPADGDQMRFRFLDNGTARTLTWGTAYVAKGGVALPSTTVLSKNLELGFEYNSNLAKWNLLASAQEA